MVEAVVCLNAHVIEFIVLGMVASLAGLVVRNWQRGRAANLAEAAPVGVPCMLRVLSQRRFKWMRGRLSIVGESVVWESGSKRRTTLALGGEQSGLRVRAAPPREWLWINPRCRIIECESLEGPVMLGVLPEALDSVVPALRGVHGS
ncbi:hypothetical protein ABH941_002342 [Streptacidiphilus sp. EB103A]